MNNSDTYRIFLGTVYSDVYDQNGIDIISNFTNSGINVKCETITNFSDRGDEYNPTGINSWIIYIGGDCCYENLVLGMFYMGLGKPISIIIENKQQLTIIPQSVTSSKKQFYCPDRNNLIKIMLKEAKDLKIPIFDSIDKFIKNYRNTSGNFDIDKYKLEVNSRLMDEDMMEGRILQRTGRTSERMNKMVDPKEKPAFNQNKYNKLGKKVTYLQKQADDYIRSPRNSSKLETIFRRFTRVNRTIEEELKYTQPHRTRPTLFAEFPYRVITKSNMNAIAPSRVPLASTGQYRTFNMNITMLMAYEWGLILHYLTCSKEDIEQVKKMIQYDTTGLKEKLGGYKNNISKIVKLYYQYKQFAEQGKLNMLRINKIRKVMKSENIDEVTTHRPYSETEILKDFINTLKLDAKAAVSGIHTEEELNDYIIHLCECINSGRHILFYHIKDYYPSSL